MQKLYLPSGNTYSRLNRKWRSLLAQYLRKDMLTAASFLCLWLQPSEVWPYVAWRQEDFPDSSYPSDITQTTVMLIHKPWTSQSYTYIRHFVDVKSVVRKVRVWSMMTTAWLRRFWWLRWLRWLWWLWWLRWWSITFGGSHSRVRGTDKSHDKYHKKKRLQW
jgi:hypothetical protein